jgi:hypothetical protein
LNRHSPNNPPLDDSHNEIFRHWPISMLLQKSDQYLEILINICFFMGSSAKEALIVSRNSVSIADKPPASPPLSNFSERPLVNYGYLKKMMAPSKLR